MIATLSGVIAEKLGEEVVLDVTGVGYGVRLTFTNSERLGTGETVKLYIYEHIKEDTHDLFGFTTLEDKQLFELLLSVKNVGPKVAMGVLDTGSSSEVRAAIASGDVKRLQSAKGVGKRAAEQIVVELRDKVGLAASESAEDIVTRGGVSSLDEAAQGLVALGYTETDAVLALKNVDADLTVEERIRQALKGKK